MNLWQNMIIFFNDFLLINSKSEWFLLKYHFLKSFNFTDFATIESFHFGKNVSSIFNY